MPQALSMRKPQPKPEMEETKRKTQSETKRKTQSETKRKTQSETKRKTQSKTKRKTQSGSKHHLVFYPKFQPVKFGVPETHLPHQSDKRKDASISIVHAGTPSVKPKQSKHQKKRSKSVRIAIDKAATAHPNNQPGQNKDAYISIIHAGTARVKPSLSKPQKKRSPISNRPFRTDTNTDLTRKFHPVIFGVREGQYSDEVEDDDVHKEYID
jgi:hypothetical protein